MTETKEDTAAELPTPDSALVEQWKTEQISLASRVVARDDDGNNTLVEQAELVGGFDISFVPGDASLACAVLVVVRIEDNTVVYEDARMVTLDLPYVPGLLAFREAPHALDLIKRLRETHPEFVPDVFMFDGNGRLHARRAGVACHVGVLADIRSIGVAKTPYVLPDEGITRATLTKLYNDANLASKPGSHCPVVTDSGETVAEIVRGGHSKVPLYISVGHRVSLESAVNLVLRLTRDAHIPEPVRQADLRGREYVRRYVREHQTKTQPAKP